MMFQAARDAMNRATPVVVVNQFHQNLGDKGIIVKVNDRRKTDQSSEVKFLADNAEEGFAVWMSVDSVELWTSTATKGIALGRGKRRMKI
jgi:hypothetical protein